MRIIFIAASVSRRGRVARSWHHPCRILPEAALCLVVALLLMTRRVAIPGFALAMWLLAAPHVRAQTQTVELTVFGGLGFGGELLETPGYEAVALQAGPVYGGTAAVQFLPKWRFEALFMREESKVRGPVYGTYVDVNVDRYMVGVQEQERLSGNLDIFGEFMLGATQYLPKGYDSELRFTLGVAAGVKTYVARNVGFRFEARGYYTPVSISGRVYCGFYGCLIGYTGTGTFQGDVSAGVIFAF
jgi:hypothetical protein